MSDAIREAFEAWAVDYTRGWYSIHEFNEDVLQFAWNAYKAALQSSQTHPAVPDGWKLVPIEPTEEMRKRAGLSRGADFYTISKVWDAMLTAAPKPDHSGGTVTDYGTKSDHIVDAPSVPEGVEVTAFGSGDYTVEVGGYADKHAVFIAPATPAGVTGDLAQPTTGEDKHRLVPGERVMTFPTEAQAFAVAEAIAGRRINRLDGSHPATPSPAQSVEEIQAGALEEYADQLDAVFANAQEAGATDCPAWHAGQFAKDARKQAARLRASQQEGGER